MNEPPDRSTVTNPDPDSPPPPRSSFRPFIRGVIVGTVILNATTLVGAAVSGTWESFAVGVGLTGVAVLVALFQRSWYAAAGLAVAFVVSPLLALPSCALRGITLG